MKTLITSLLASSLLFAGCSDSAEETSAPNDSAESAQTTAPTEHAYANVTDASLEQFASSSDVAVLEFWATWCGPCKIMGPRFESVAGEMQNQASFGKVDVDENPKTASKYKIRSIPTVIILKDGKVVETLVGVMPKDKLAAKVSQHLTI